MKFLIMILAILAGFLAVITIGSKQEVEEIYATFVTDTGGINDGSFSEGTWEGVQYFADEYQLTVDYIETTDAAQYETNLQLASDQSPVVVASGFNFAIPMYNIATQNPDTKYILIDAEPTNPETNAIVNLPNVKSYYFNEEQAGYLVGYIAGSMTHTNQISFIGGQEIPPVQNFAKGYEIGATEANPEISVDIQYSNTWTDAATVQTMSQTLISQGTDIIFSATGNAGMGAVNAAVEHTIQGEEIYIIGCDVNQAEAGIYTDQNGEEQSVVITSALKNVGTAAYQGLEMIYNDEWNNETVVLDLTNGGVGIPDTNPYVNDEYEKAAYESALAYYGGQ